MDNNQNQPIPQQPVPNQVPVSQPQQPQTTQPPSESFEPAVSPVQTSPIPPSQPIEPSSDGHPKAPLYLLVLIVMIVTIAALSLIFLNFSKPVEPKPSTASQNQKPTTSQPTATIIPEDKDTKALEMQGTSDDPNEIEKDLNKTDFSTLDKEAGSISAELGQ